MLGYKKVLNMVDFDGSDKVEPQKTKRIFFFKYGTIFVWGPKCKKL